MKITELKGRLPDEIIESISKRGISELTPPQELAIEKGLLSQKSITVAAPTASGKTLIAEMAMLKAAIWNNKKAVYVGPMRALVSEKYSELKEAYPYMNIGISIGDLDSLDKWLEKCDIILVSTEKLDSLIRHGLLWLDQIGCIVFDEIHMLDEVGRGPTLEILISKLRRLSREAQIIALSATIGNAEEISKWLGSELVKSDYRPVPLERGIELDGNVIYGRREREERLAGKSERAEIRIVEDTLSKGKQLILFYSTRRSTESGAENLAVVVRETLSEQQREDLRKVSKEILGFLGRPTAQCEKLARAIENGVAFHHSGLVNAQRKIVEEAFRRGKIKVICSTTTLGFGVNMPAHTVVVRDTSRYDGGFGSRKISVNEVLQLFGRAGRPKYDKMGRALLIAKNKEDAKVLYKRYIEAGPEPITSKLGVLPVLRSHILAFVASDFLTRDDSILTFLNETFYGYQYSDSATIEGIVREVLRELEEWKFIESRVSRWQATRIGEKVSELYIDPVSAKWIIDSIPRLHDDVSGLFMIANTLEMKPLSKATEEAEEKILDYEQMLQGGHYEDTFYEPERAFGTALLLRDWISEKSEAELLASYSETPGSLYTKVSNADWLLYSSMELSKLMKVNHTRLLELRARVRYGIKNELLDLVGLEQVGRVRARMMFNSGIRGVADLRKEGAEQKLERLFGKEIANRIYSQVKGFVD